MNHIIVLLTLLFQVSFIQFVYASSSIVATPIEGGTSLSLGRIDRQGTNLSKQIRIRVSAESAYQVYQRLNGPIVNERGEQLNANALTSYTLSGSNGSGTLYQQNDQPVTMGDGLIYASNPDGLSDSFTVIYSIHPELIRNGGNFTGEILYSIRPISGRAEETAIIKVYFELSGKFKIEVSGSNNSSKLYLSTISKFKQEDHLTIKYSGNLRNDIKIYQDIQFPINERNLEIPADAIQFSVIASKDASQLVSALTKLRRGRQIIYASNNPEDKIDILYKIDPDFVKSLRAGVYTGKVNFYIENEGVNQSIEMDFIIDVRPIFNMNVEYPAGNLGFGNILPGTEPKFKEITIEINSNLGRPYILNQHIDSLMTNKEGSTIPEDYFLIKKEKISNGPGHIIHNQFSPIKIGEYPVFVSDNSGSSMKIKLLYQIQPYKQIKPGDYSTNIDYTLLEK